MRKVIFGALVCFAGLCCLPVWAQGNALLRGMVKDTKGNVVSQAIVAVENTSFGAYTDELGQYAISLKTGSYMLFVSAFGYNTIRMSLQLSGDSVQNFTLAENAHALHAVEVYGKSKTQELKESAFSVNALDLKPQAGSLSHLSKMVDRSSGLKIREDGGAGSDFELSINGMSGNSVRYFLDGIPLDAKGSGVSLANLPVNVIERVEIYKGVVPSQLGADALGGAINVITRQDTRHYMDVTYSIGSFNTHQFNLFAQYTDRKTGLLFRPTLAVNYSKNNYLMKGVELWDEEARKFKQVDLPRFHDGYFSLLAQVETGVRGKRWADLFLLSASRAVTEKEMQTGTIQSIVYGDARREQAAWNLSVQYRKKDLFVPGLYAQATLSQTWDHALTMDTAFRKYRWDGSYIYSHRNEITGRGKSLRHYHRPLTITHLNIDYTLNAQHSFNLNYMMNRTGNHRYDEADREFVPSTDVLAKHITGLSYTQSFLKQRLSNTFFLKNYMSYLHVEQQDLYWITGSRNESGSSLTNHWGFGAGSRWSLSEVFAVKASYENSIRLPLTRELLGNGTTVYPNFKLRPESSNNLNAGVFGSLRLAPSHLLYYEAGLFYRNVEDYIHAVISEAEGLSQYDNVSDVDVTGVEGEVVYTFGNTFRAVVNASYQDARSKTRYYPDGSPVITYNNKIPNRPWLFGNAELHLSQPGLTGRGNQLRLMYYYQYVHWFFLTWEGYGNLKGKSRIPTQHISSIVLSHSFRHGTYNISLECNNLFDRKVYDNFMLQKPGRAFLCKIRFFIN